MLLEAKRLNLRHYFIIFDAMLFINGTINSGSGFRRADLRIKDGKIQQIGILQPDDSEEVIDIAGKILLPGFVDVHVHFREPGFGYKETIESGSKAAAAGGYTAVCTMPNLAPPPDSVANINIQKEIIAKSAVVKVYPLATITVGQKGGGSLIDFDSMKHEVAFSDDGRGVQSREMMAEAMKEVAKFDGMIVAHCEVDELVKGGYIHDGEYCSRHGHKGICSRSEWEQVARDVELAKATGCRYHVCHVSTKESVDIIRKAKAEGVRVTCETAPHYLILSDLDLEEDGRFKMNPPIRSVEDREALRAGLIDGTIDVIATDHAPHSAEEKSRGLARSAFGIVGLETAFSLIYTHLVEKGIISWELLIKTMSINPRQIFRLGGGLAEGAPADITVIDPAAKWTICPDKFVSKGKATPFADWEVDGKVEMTFVDGKRVF